LFFALFFAVDGFLVKVFCLIVSVILYFANWYNAFFGGVAQFFALFFTFIFSILCLVEGSNYYFLVLGWEMMGFMSYFLIGLFFAREQAQSSALLALLSNRFRDFCLFCFLFFDGGLFFALSIMAKSSLALFCSWLPNAMEGPTPVSSLLHSSTMVVAGVFLFCFFGLFGAFLGALLAFFGCFLGFFGGFFKDFKRIIAYSTSSQLVLIGSLFCFRHFFASVFYVVVHASFKASVFIFCGMLIHASDSQLVASISPNTLF
jgi:NADH:ubiquinone oxidoreductase subunit 5 (subunit L)/multisubunit Na+/H+ antiporter MnhA subunit